MTVVEVRALLEGWLCWWKENGFFDYSLAHLKVVLVV
jgi:hypothetical protein